MKNNYDVFLSYRREGGKDVASVLNTAIESEGYSTYFDVSENYTGDFFDNIEESVKNSDLFVLVVSEGSLERFKNPKDISRFELETAIESNKEILPITLIGDKMFEELNKEGMPKCVQKLKTLNTRFYLHESKKDTIDYVIELCEKMKIKKFEAITNNISSSLKSFLSNIEEKIEGSFSCCNSISNKNSLIYTGKLKDNIPYGEGTIKDLNGGDIYIMNFYGDYKLHGRGEIVREGKTIYKGEIRSLKPDGEGTLFEKDGVYEGILQKGMKNITGSYKFKDGSYYKGDWEDNRITGYGYMKYANGDEYRGMFSNGQRNGAGTLIRTNGDRFEGTWGQDLLAEGIKVGADNKAYKGRFGSDLEMKGEVKVFDLSTNKVVYSGRSEEGLYQGRGELKLDKGGVEELNIPYFNIKPLGLQPELNPRLEPYTITGEFKEGELDIEQDIRIEDKEGTPLFIKEGTTYTYPTLNMKYEEFMEFKVVTIEEGGNKYNFSLKEGFFLLDAKYEIEGKIVRGNVLANGEESLKAWNKIENEMKEVKLVEIFAEDFPNILQEKFKEYIKS